MKKEGLKVLLSAGGTGGHLFPAQAIADKIRDECTILFVGKLLSQNRYFDQKKYPFKEISAATFSSKSPWKLLKASFQIVVGVFQSLKIIREFQPDYVIGFGSFFTLPLLIAALIKRVPIILHEQNSVPGKVNRLFSPYAKLSAITFPLTAKLMKGKTQMVEFPSRFELKKIDRAEALGYFGLKEDKQTLLVFGGSQGGKGLNELVQQMAVGLAKEKIQILHFAGNKEAARAALETYQKLSIDFCVKEFETRMNAAWSIADLAITRAGAATIAELIAWQVPAILIPFPFATEDHQAKNGDFFVSTVKGGEMFIEKNATSAKLLASLQSLLEGSLQEKKENIRRYKETNDYPKLEEIIKKGML
jgi:UDP-N-acetylglucosamine--N-acetylmuramyl-(pentapeptide) pyrophosphoryl-undecaprenol N-acetylglucosamine transferase